jgi:formate hydrogenlyase transcriptional activator
MVACNQFRSDLYYRLNVFPVLMPALRERREDIPKLVLHFAGVFSRRMGKRIEQIPQSTMDAFSAHDWPGNVRELQNLVERAVIRSDDGVLWNPFLTAQSVRSSARKIGPDRPPGDEVGKRMEPIVVPEPTSTASIQDIQREHILRVLEKTGWVISGRDGAGAVLNLHPSTLRSMMNRLGIRRENRVK